MTRTRSVGSCEPHVCFVYVSLSGYKCSSDLDGCDPEDVIQDIKDVGVCTFGERMKGGAKGFIRRV